MEQTALEFCKNRRIGACGLRRSHHCLAVSSGPRWSSVRFRRPVPRQKPGHPRVSLVISSSVGRVHVGPSALAPGRLPWGLSSASRRPSSESTVRRASQARLRSALSVSHALDGLLLAGACRLVSSCCHVPDFRSGLSPRPSCATSSVAMPSRRWRRASVAGCPTTPSRAASTSGPCSRSGFRGARRGVSPSRVRVPIALSSFGLVAADLASAMNRGSTLGLVARCYESGVRWPWRLDRPTASMLYR